MTPIVILALVIAGAGLAVVRLSRIASAIAYAALVVAVLFGWHFSLGHARPVGWHSGYAGKVVAYRLDEPHAIYLWMVPKGQKTPLSLQLPWREKKAAQLQKAAHAARKAHQGLRMRLGGKKPAKLPQGQGRFTLHHVPPTFYPAPQPGLPPKVRR